MKVEFKVCEVKRTGVKSAVNIKLVQDNDESQQLGIKKRGNGMLSPLPEEITLPPFALENGSIKSPTPEVIRLSPPQRYVMGIQLFWNLIPLCHNSMNFYERVNKI